MPSAFNAPWMAVIATATFSRAVAVCGARASTPTVTKARSGARSTTAVPVIVTRLGPGSCAAAGPASASTAAHAKNIFLMAASFSISLSPERFGLHMRIETFAMERMQSTWENRVAANLSESGVHPMTTRELLEADDPSALLDEPLAYTQSNGTIALRERIAALYPGTTVDQIQVTNGGSEANFVSLWQMVEPDDEIVMMTPNYMQAWGLVRGFGGRVREWKLRLEHGRYHADLDALNA